MRIAICDDEKIWLAQITEYIESIKQIYTDIEYDKFLSGEDLLICYNDTGNIYDILIMDIELNGTSGLDVAEQIRKRDNSVIIFFLTSHEEYVYECFKSYPMGFWRKPVKYEIFKKDMKLAYEKILSSHQYIKIIENRNKIRINCNDIIYIENKERKSYIYTTSSVHTTNQLLSQFIAELDDRFFVRVYKSFIVNLSYIYIIRENEIQMYNSDVKIPLSRTYKASLTEKYINFKEKERF